VHEQVKKIIWFFFFPPCFWWIVAEWLTQVSTLGIAKEVSSPIQQWFDLFVTVDAGVMGKVTSPSSSASFFSSKPSDKKDKG
jgi:hypothetical protein